MPKSVARLYLITPPVDGSPLFATQLDAALGSDAIACVLFRTVAGEEDVGLADLVGRAQARGAAALLVDDTAIAARVNADGVHVEGLPGLAAAIRKLKPAHIVGAGALETRDDAMTAGESGADYVMLGDGAASEGGFDDHRERVAWWAEIFQVPCVAMAGSLAEVAPLAETGVEFIGVSDLVWNDPRGPAAAINDIAAAAAEGHQAWVAQQEPVS